MSIRRRLALAIALVLFATLALLGVILVQRTRSTLVSQVDQQIVTNATHRGGGRFRSAGPGPAPRATDGSAPDPAGPMPRSPSATAPFAQERVVARFVYDASGTLTLNEPAGFSDAPKSPPLLPTIPSPALDLLLNRIATTSSVDHSTSYRVLVTRDTDGDILVTAVSLDRVDAAVSQLTHVFLLIGALALGAATLAVWLVIRRGLRPVDRMIATAAAIAGGDLTQRVPDANPRTELGRLGTALNDMLHQIEEAIQVRANSEARLRRFVGDAAHELRTPLTSVRGYAELYRQGAIPNEAGIASAMGRIEAEGSRMARLVDEMLLLARLDQQRGLEQQPVDLVPLAQEAAADFRATAPDRTLTENLVGQAIVSGDPLRLRQVIDNLLANARTHTAPGTPVHLRVTQQRNDVQLAVTDEGGGISAEDQERIFERFWRADPARARSRGGSGLGLAIVASIVEAHGGTITVESDLGHGATFVVRFPAIRTIPVGMVALESATTSGRQNATAGRSRHDPAWSAAVADRAASDHPSASHP